MATNQTEVVEIAAARTNRQVILESLQLHGSDHPSMILISACLNGKNFLTWSCAIKRALCAKTKLGFVDGTNLKPAVTDPLFEHWIRVDSMVTTWILDSISKEIVEGFIYTKSVRKLWTDLEQRYGGCNGPQLYQFQRAITSLCQGNATVGSYFTNGGETIGRVGGIDLLLNVPAMAELVRSKYGFHESVDATTMVVRGGFKKEDRRRGHTDKKNLVCDHCNKPGHSKDTCFKIHGTPDWYKEMIEQQKKEQGMARGYTVQTDEFKGVINHNQKETKESLLLQELVKLIKGRDQNMQQYPPPQAHFAQHDNFAGIHSVSVNLVVHLPDGTTQKVTHIGDILLYKHLTLSNVLYVRSFKYNLLSVPKLCSLLPMEVLFHSTHCILLDPITDSHLPKECDACAMAKMHRQPFSSHQIQTSAPFELLHVDVWGPYKISSLTGCHYFLTLVDDFSRGL
ncbi:UNVERIFIED_CONTAM: hypothetical protein Sradi_7129300 [Sesamum radiatum]|uniref:Retrotransposon Copia-like N-terminal domain-containing protein n=1 Tax=Sesamum radiatum TaxID=300843 RepID=A0AAW2IZ16_SESRA